jgi:membrane-associated protein
VVSLTLAGYLFGNVPFVKNNLDKIIWAMILIPGVIVMLGAWKGRRRAPVA